jgi:hypothetical protein
VSNKEHQYNLSKLSGLRNQPKKFSWFKIGRGSIGNRFSKHLFLVFTVCTIVCIVILHAGSRASHSYSLLISKQDELSAALNELWSITPNLEQNVEATLTDLIQNSLSPINDFIGTEALMNYELQRLYKQIYLWKNTLYPLQQFTLTSAGFTNGLSKIEFTTVLEKVLVDTEIALNESQSYYTSLLPYRILSLGSSAARKMMKVIKTLFKITQKVIDNKNILLELLGHYSSQTILLVNQNTGEARPTGGFIGSYIVMSISSGRLSIKESQSIYWVSNSTPQRIVAHPITWNVAYSKVDAHGLHNLNYFACFEDSAKLFAKEFVKSSNGFSIDQLYMITPDLLESLLPNDLILSVKDVGVLNKSNLIDTIERLTSFQAIDRSNPKKQMSEIFKSLLNSFTSILGSIGLTGLVQKIINGVASRSIQFWYPENSTMNMLNSLGFRSDHMCANKYPNTIGLVTVGGSADKRSSIIKSYLGVSAKPGLGNVEVLLNYTQYLNETQFLERGFDDWLTFNFMGFQIPKEATNISVDTDSYLPYTALKKYYFNDLENDGKKEFQIPSEIQTVIDGAKNIENGVIYPNADGSILAGSYIYDKKGATTLKIKFTLPYEFYKKLTIYPQPGMNEITLYNGENVSVAGEPYKRIIETEEFKRGVELAIH